MPYIIYIYDPRLDYYDWFRTNVNVGRRTWQPRRCNDCVFMIPGTWED